MLERLHTRFPDVDPDHLRALAVVWSREADRVITAMLRLSREGSRHTFPEDARHEVVLELAKLSLWLEERIVEKRTAGLKPWLHRRR